MDSKDLLKKWHKICKTYKNCNMCPLWNISCTPSYWNIKDINKIISKVDDVYAKLK